MLEILKGEELSDSAISEFYDDGELYFRFKIIGKIRKDGTIYAIWFEQYKDGIFRNFKTKFKKRKIAVYEFQNHCGYWKWLNQMRKSWSDTFPEISSRIINS